MIIWPYLICSSIERSWASKSWRLIRSRIKWGSYWLLRMIILGIIVGRRRWWPKIWILTRMMTIHWHWIKGWDTWMISDSWIPHFRHVRSFTSSLKWWKATTNTILMRAATSAVFTRWIPRNARRSSYNRWFERKSACCLDGGNHWTGHWRCFNSGLLGCNYSWINCILRIRDEIGNLLFQLLIFRFYLHHFSINLLEKRFSKKFNYSFKVLCVVSSCLALVRSSFCWDTFDLKLRISWFALFNWN